MDISETFKKITEELNEKEQLVLKSMISGDFTHYWKNNGNETCAKTFINEKGEIDCKYKRCVLVDGAVDCPEYHKSI